MRKTCLNDSGLDEILPGQCSWYRLYLQAINSTARLCRRLDLDDDGVLPWAGLFDRLGRSTAIWNLGAYNRHRHSQAIKD